MKRLLFLASLLFSTSLLCNQPTCSDFQSAFYCMRPKTSQDCSYCNSIHQEAVGYPNWTHDNCLNVNYQEINGTFE